MRDGITVSLHPSPQKGQSAYAEAQSPFPSVYPRLSSVRESADMYCTAGDEHTATNSHDFAGRWISNFAVQLQGCQF